MGWASYAENIEDLRQHRAAIEKPIKKVQTLVSKVKISNPARVGFELNNFVENIKAALDETLQRVSDVFQEAERKLEDPNVRIVKRLDKKTSTISMLREKLEKAERHLASCREKGKQNEGSLRVLRNENADLKKQIAALADKAAFLTAANSVRPLRRR